MVLAPKLSPAQLERLHSKSIFYVLDTEVHGVRHVYKIAEMPDNHVYTLRCDIDTGATSCSCLDHIIRCKIDRMACKHMCFFIHGVLGMPLESDDAISFYTKHTLTHEMTTRVIDLYISRALGT